MKELREALHELSTYFFDMPAHVRTKELETRSFFTLLSSELSSDDDDMDTEALHEIAQKFSNWLSEYMRSAGLLSDYLPLV